MNIANNASCFCAYINNIPSGFIAIKNFPHPTSKNIRMVHRLVVLPDFQGIGIGTALLDFFGNEYKKKKLRLRIVTSQPALVYSLKKNKKWALTDYGRFAPHNGTTGQKRSSSGKRFVTSWEYVEN